MAGQAERTQPDLLYRRKGSPNWRLKLQYPTAELRAFATLFWQEVAAQTGVGFNRPVRAVEDVSLKTSDRTAARAMTTGMRHQHERLMIAWAQARDERKQTGRIIQQHAMPPGTNRRHDDGSLDVATDTDIITIMPDGTQTKRPNSVGFHVQLFEQHLSPDQKRTIAEGEAEHRKAVFKDVDAEIVENYIRRKGKNAEDAAEVRNTLAEFKAFVGSRTLAQCKRADAEGFIEWLATKGGKKGTGVSAGTIKRRIAGLKAAINIEIKQTDDPRLTRNVFELVEIEGEESHREAWSEEDMAAVRARLHEFEPDELLLWVWHASTGIRPIEIHGIDFEDVEEAKDPKDIDPATGQPRVYRTRYVGIEKGGKDYSQRALPIPQAVLDLRDAHGVTLLPAKIDGPLFTRSVERINDAINGKLETWGIKRREGGKSFYSCRHRVHRRMMDEGVTNDEVTRAITGHNRTVEPHHKYGRRRGYGHRFSMWKLKAEIDKIGY